MTRRNCAGVVIVAVIAIVQAGCLCGPCEEATTNKEIVLAAFEAVAAGDFDSLDALIAPDFVRHCQATPEVEVTSLQAFKDFLQMDRESFPEQEFTVTHLISEDNLVAFWITYSGVQNGPMGPFPATGKRMDVEVAGIHRIEGGLIAETWVTWDNMSGLMQLGLWPPEEVPVEETAS